MKVSPSAIETWRTCPRKHALQSIFNAPKAAPSKGVLFGREVDRIVELALEKGERFIDPQDPTPGETAREIIAVLPAVGCVTQKSYEIVAPSTLDYLWTGRLDVYADREIPLVCDIKTRAHERHVLRAAGFPTDPQCVQYAFAHNKGRGVDLQWVTALTGTKREPIVERSRWSSEQVKEYAGVLALDSDKIVTLRRSKPASPDDVEYNISGCEAYGGCPYRGNLCNLPLSAMTEALFGKEGTNQMSNLMSQLQAQSAGTNAPAPKDDGTVEPMNMAAFFGKASPVAAVRGSQAYAQSKAQALPADMTAPNGRALPEYMKSTGIVQDGGQFWAIHDVLEIEGPERAGALLNAVSLPPDGPAVNPPESANAATPAATLAAIEAPAPQTTAVEAKPVAAPAETEAPKRRGRPKGSKNAGASAKPASSEGRTLYIGCAPLGVDYTAIEDLYADAHDAIAREKGVPDFALLPYGEGAAAFRGFVVAAWNGEGPGEYVVQDPHSREATIVLAALCQGADKIVRGLR